MTLRDFLKQTGTDESDIMDLSGEEALKAVQMDGNSLRYVHEQTPEICLAAVKEYGHALRYVHEQTPEICLAAVKKDKSAIQYVNKSIFEQAKEMTMTMAELEDLLGYPVKIKK